jgi:hypothetical protein
MTGERGNEGGEAGQRPPEGEGPPGGTSLAVVVFVILLIAGGIWVVNEMADSARYQDCAASRRRNCDGIDYRAVPPPSEAK